MDEFIKFGSKLPLIKFKPNFIKFGSKLPLTNLPLSFTEKIK